MKTIYKTLFFVLFLLITFSQAQNWIKDFEGIAIDAGLNYDWVTNNPYAVDSMKQAGIDIVHLSIGNHSQLNTLTSSNPYPYNYRFQVLPFKSVDNLGNSYDWIQYYSDAKYTKWEAEGTPISEGEATLEPNLSKADNNGTFITRKGDVPNSIDTLIKGPYYRQDVKYYTDNCDTVTYRADFRMKIENNSIPPIEGNPEDTICIIQVTQSDISNYATSPWTIGGTHIIQQRVIKRLHFEQLNQFDTLSFSYKLRYDSSQSTSPANIEEFRTVFVDPPCDYLIRGRNYIQFKVIWKGKSNPEGFPQYLLSIDNVIVYDVRGASLKDPESVAIQNIEAQDISLRLFHNSVTGWIGIDEPRSIDQYEPIKIVTQILNDNSDGGKRTLYIPFAGTWDGAWNNSSPNNYGAMRLNPLIEFHKRVGNANIIHNSYLFDIPCSENSPPGYTACWTGEDQRSINIWRQARLNYSYLYDLDPNFGVSIQCGAIKPPHGITSWQRNIARKELLYTANLALMYGAKFLSLYTYFAQAPLEDSSTTNLTYHAIVDYHKYTSLQGTVYTDKYFTLKDTLAPRLSGLFGKTLKKLIPYADTLGKNPSTNYILNFNKIEQVRLANYNGSEALNSLIEIGTFKMPEESTDDYFMIINRYYSEPLLNQFYIKLRNLCGYKNWNLFNYVDSTSSTLLPNIDGDVSSPTDTIVVGDAILYSIKPVVEFGGKLLANETVLGGTTLTDNMTIENGATLYLIGNYNANANITVKNGGKLKYGNDNSKIIFSNGAKLILEGNAQVSGLSSTSKLTLQYDASTSFGVVVNPGASPIISYCNITGPLNGISVENEATINVLNTSISNCSNTGIALFHFGNGDSFSTLSTPNIYKCSISNCGTAISTVNCSEVIIKENTITQCNLGLYFNMVNSAYISSNTILGWQSATGSPMPGISMSSSGGYLRNNTIRYHNFGVLLAYSSPDMGVNSIEYNYKCGVYSDVGSYPNLVQQLANPECWYPIGGCNVIKNNGTFTQFPPSNPSIQPDGAEIFLNSGDVFLSYGYNEISDDRTGIPTYLTVPLIKGTRSTGGSREFFVDHNYWGTVGPSPSRFGTLEADYDPTSDYCPLPDAPCSGSELIIQTTDGLIVDTLDSREREISEISALEENYANADKLFYSGEIEEAKIYYLTIVQGNYTNREKLYAYNKLYEIGELLKEESSYFTELQNAFNSIVEVETDTLLLKAFNQRSILCDVSKEEYVTAINKFDNIIQQNPNSEEAVYAEIDIITTALNIDTTNPGLGKIGSKYLVKGTSDYLSKLNDILQSKFGINSEDEKHIIPKEYSLHQNYPNPFNPSTIIKFDLPNDGLVQLEIFDILGRRITTLVNEYKSAGSYEQQFDASSLASGVYVYKLQAGDFVSSKKMILLK